MRLNKLGTMQGGFQMQVNQDGEDVVVDLMFQAWGSATNEERDEAIRLICEHLKVHIVRTNATKGGRTELQLRKDDE